MSIYHNGIRQETQSCAALLSSWGWGHEHRRTERCVHTHACTRHRDNKCTTETILCALKSFFWTCQQSTGLLPEILTQTQ